MSAEHFDAVVVGSGFGGSVTACHLAEHGKRVCVLERGRAYPPGSFPRSPTALSRAFWDPSEGHYGMFDLWSFRGLEALVSSGLGGGSLIYANVLIRKDERWFVDEEPFGTGYERWPITRADLEPHYERVERAMGVQTYPLSSPPYDQTPKTLALRHAASDLGIEWRLPNLAVTFHNPGQPPIPGEPIVEEHPNLHGRTRDTCRLCGECDIGCNYGSKNTLDYTYLSTAKRHGADIRELCEVRTLRPLDGMYEIGYVRHDLEQEGTKLDTGALPLQSITADRLVMAAGALGSTYLLLKNREAFPALSKTLGTRFCGNGDLLGFLRTRDGRRTPGRRFDPSTGPVITSTTRVPDALDGEQGRGFYIQDGGYPGFVDWMVETAGFPGLLRRMVVFAAKRVWAALSRNPKSNLGAAVAALLADGGRSGSVLPMLGMGRDVPDGTMSLERGYLANDWTVKSSKEYFARVSSTMEDIARALDADFRVNPTWYLKRVITVHPLGGCPMGRDPSEGVVDPFGEAFGHPGLYVLDGSALPGPVGPNPSLTIAAFADRAAQRMLGDD